MKDNNCTGTACAALREAGGDGGQAVGAAERNAARQWSAEGAAGRPGHRGPGPGKGVPDRNFPLILVVHVVYVGMQLLIAILASG